MVEKEFLYLRGYCLNVLETPCRESVHALHNALGQIEDDSTLQQLQEYTLLPLFEILRTRKRSEEVIVDAVKCITQLLMLTRLDKWKLFSQISFNVVMLISNKDDVDTVSVANISEELKSAVCECLSELLIKSNESILKSAFGSDFLPQIGHIVYILLQLAENERSQEVRCSAMTCLQNLRGPLDASDELRISIGNCLANFIPGISMTMTKVAIDGGLAGQAITVTALKVWQHLVCIVIGDQQLIRAKNTKVQQPQIGQDVKRPLKPVSRTEDWSKNTSEKLAILMEKLSQLDSHGNFKVRLALAEWAQSLLVECKNSLSVAVPSSIGVLITLSCDDIVEINTLCKSALGNFAETLQIGEKSLVEVLQENLLNLVLDLARIRNSGDSKKLSLVNKLHGYFTILGPSLNIIINSSTHLEKLSTSLLQLMEMDCSDVRMVAERKNDAGYLYSLEELEQLGPRSMSKRFRYFRDDKIHNRVYEVCRLFGKFGDLQLLLDHFTDQFHKSIVFRKEAVLLLNYIISGTQLRSAILQPFLQEELFQICSNIVDDYITPFVWDLKYSSETDRDRVVDDGINYSQSTANLILVKAAGCQTVAPNSITQLNSNIIQMCLLLEGLGILAMVLKEKFRPLLIKVLYEVLEKLGTFNVTISQTALLTVSKIAHFCSYDSISDILLKNSDYLLNSVMLKLRYKPLECKAPRVLCVTLDHGDHQMLDAIMDVICEVCHNLDARPDDRSLPHLQVLLSLVKAITRWHPPHCARINPGSKLVNENENSKKESVYDYILKHHKLCQISSPTSERFNSSDQDSDASDNNESNIVSETVEDPPTEEKKPPPKHVQLVVKVLHHCRHHLPSKNLSIRLLILDILDPSFVALQDHEDEMLPMVHKIWAPLLQRLCDDDDLLTMKKAFHTLCAICRLCSDFVRQRVVKEIWPRLIRFLEKHATISCKRGTNFSYTVAYKFLMEILSNLGDLVIILEVSELDVDRLSTACVFYLSCHQPKAIQIAAVNLFERLSLWVPDLIWLKLGDLRSESINYTHPNPDLEVIELGGTIVKGEFDENIAELFKRLDHM